MPTFTVDTRSFLTSLGNGNYQTTAFETGYSYTFTDGQPDGPGDTGFQMNEMLSGQGGETYQYLGYYNNSIILQQVGFPRPYAYGPSGDVPRSTTITSVQQEFAICFMAGTLIETLDAPRPVEDLAEGDMVLGTDGQERPIKWMWRQTVKTFFADPLRSLPIRIAAGALGDQLPRRDLCVSPDHALLINGLLVHADALVNGTSIVRISGLPETFIYYHIELEDHALVMAEGVAAETFVDNVTRRRFDNWAEYESRFGDAPAINEMDLPRVKSARMLPRAIKTRLEECAMSLGLVIPVAA